MRWRTLPNLEQLGRRLSNSSSRRSAQRPAGALLLYQTTEMPEPAGSPPGDGQQLLRMPESFQKMVGGCVLGCVILPSIVICNSPCMYPLLMSTTLKPPPDCSSARPTYNAQVVTMAQIPVSATLCCSYSSSSRHGVCQLLYSRQALREDVPGIALQSLLPHRNKCMSQLCVRWSYV